MHDLTIFKLPCGRLTLKSYTKGERVLRIEAMAHNTHALGRRRALAEFPLLVNELRAVLERLVDALACVDRCSSAANCLTLCRSLPGGAHESRRDRPEQTAHALGGRGGARPGDLAARLTASDLAQQAQPLGARAASTYTPRRAAPADLKKLRGKGLVDRIEGTRRYEAGAGGLKTLATLTVLRTQVIEPLPAAAHNTGRARGALNPSPLDRHYEALRTGMLSLVSELGIAA